MNPMHLNIAGLGVGLLGSFVLAISLSRVVGELVLAITFIDTTLGALCAASDIPRFEGIDRRLTRGLLSGSVRTTIGFLLLVASFALQLAAILLGGA